MEDLTRRESEVLRLLTRGASNKEIAREMKIGIGTVKSHMTHLMLKARVHARTQLATLALREGWVPLDEAVPDRKWVRMTR